MAKSFFRCFGLASSKKRSPGSGNASRTKPAAIVDVMEPPASNSSVVLPFVLGQGDALSVKSFELKTVDLKVVDVKTADKDAFVGLHVTAAVEGPKEIDEDKSVEYSSLVKVPESGFPPAGNVAETEKPMVVDAASFCKILEPTVDGSTDVASKGHQEDGEYDTEDEEDGGGGQEDGRSEGSSSHLMGLGIEMRGLQAGTETYYDAPYDQASGVLDGTDCARSELIQTGNEGSARVDDGHASDPEAYIQRWDRGTIDAVSCTGQSLLVGGGHSAPLGSEGSGPSHVASLSDPLNGSFELSGKGGHGKNDDQGHASDPGYVTDPDSPVDSTTAWEATTGRAADDNTHGVAAKHQTAEAFFGAASLVMKKVPLWKNGLLRGHHSHGKTTDGTDAASVSKSAAGMASGYETEGESSDRVGGLLVEQDGRESPQSDSVLMPKRVAQLRRQLSRGDRGGGAAIAWREEGGGPTDSSASVQSASAVPCSSAGDDDKLTEERVSLTEEQVADAKPGGRKWVDEWLSRLADSGMDDMEVDHEVAVLPTSGLMLRSRSVSVGAGMESLAGGGSKLAHLLPPLDGPVAPPLASPMNADGEIAQAVMRSIDMGATSVSFQARGLKMVPAMIHFTNLKTIDLARNCIVRIHPGCLPKGLRHLDLSHNKLTSVEGLRDLSSLRTLKLNSNHITHLGHGLANCSALRELSLSDNKIFEVEGLHRLLKLSVLDLSFNKITTTKALGQLAANHNSMQVLNLVGNPVVANLGEDQFRRFITGLVPRLTSLNKPVRGAAAESDLKDHSHGHDNHAKQMSRSSGHSKNTSPSHSHSHNRKRISGGAGGSTSFTRGRSRASKSYTPPTAAQLAALEAAASVVAQNSHRRHSHHHHNHHHHRTSATHREITEGHSRGHKSAASSAKPPVLPPSKGTNATYHTGGEGQEGTAGSSRKMSRSMSETTLSNLSAE